MSYCCARPACRAAPTRRPSLCSRVFGWCGVGRSPCRVGLGKEDWPWEGGLLELKLRHLVLLSSCPLCRRVRGLVVSVGWCGIWGKAINQSLAPQSNNSTIISVIASATVLAQILTTSFGTHSSSLLQAQPSPPPCVHITHRRASISGPATWRRDAWFAPRSL